MQVWNVLYAARWNTGRKKVAKNRHLGTIVQLCWAISSQLRHVSTIGKNLLSSNMSFRCSHNMANMGPLTAEIGPVVWGTAANFNGFHVLAALLHGSQVVSVSQTLRRCTEGSTYVRQGDHHVEYWPTFLVIVLVNSKDTWSGTVARHWAVGVRCLWPSSVVCVNCLLALSSLTGLQCCNARLPVTLCRRSSCIMSRAKSTCQFRHLEIRRAGDG